MWVNTSAASSEYGREIPVSTSITSFFFSFFFFLLFVVQTHTDGHTEKTKLFSKIKAVQSYLGIQLGMRFVKCGMSEIHRVEIH